MRRKLPMRKPAYCAQCGQEIIYGLKSIPSAGVVVTLVEPHTCLEEAKKNPYKNESGELNLKPAADKPKSALDKMFDDFNFAKELSKDSIPTTTVFDRSSGDKRPKESIRDDVKDSKSLAPSGVLSAVKNSANTQPENELKE
jgi:hypothetical protein